MAGDLLPRINLAHLDHLSTPLAVDGPRVLATWVYADAPGYARVGDADEGIACVDDTARAAVVYLDEHARSGSAHALEQARGALGFTLRMQEPDGRFANFVTDLRGTVNRSGPTSRPGLGWWAFRGMWALARGYREFAGCDAGFAAQLLAAYRRTEGALVTELAKAGDATMPMRGREVPAWLQRFAPDAISVAAIALAEMQEALPNPVTRAALEQVAGGVAAVTVRRGEGGAFDHAGHTPAGPELWHAWGAHEGEALARAGALLRRPDLVEAARREVEGLLAWQLAAGRVHELGPSPVRSGQQAYGVAAAVRAAMALHRATGEARYAQMAGLHASWFAGNNMAREPMYDAATGRGYDGIDAAPRGVNRSSGGESTIEALMALEAIAGTPIAERFAAMRPVGAQPATWVRTAAIDLRAAGAAGATGPALVSRPASSATGAPAVTFAQLAPGARATFDVDVAASGDYVLLAGRMRGGATALRFTVGGAPLALLPAGPTPPGGPHVAFDRADGTAVHLAAGRHRIDVTALGAPGAAPALVEAVVLHPATARTELQGADGARTSLSWNMDDARLGIAERGRAAPQL